MKNKKAFTLAEVLIVLLIMSALILVVITTLKPDKYDVKTNLAQAQKLLAIMDNAFAQIIATEPTQCPAGKYMIKPAGTSSWEFIIMNSANSDKATSQDLVNLFKNHIKYESDVVNFCDNTSYCSDTNIKGAKVAGGAYIGFSKYDSIKDCPAYYMPGVQGQLSAPKSFTNGASVTKKCWGELYMDVNGIKGPDTIGQDVFIYGLGEYGIEK